MSIASQPQTQVDIQISTWRSALGAKSNADLARMLGYNPSTLTQWRNRGSVPDAALKRFQIVEKHGVLARERQAKQLELGEGTMAAGLQLTLWLAPSRDAVPTRISPMRFTGMMLEFSSLFSEIQLAAAEDIATLVQADPQLSPQQAFERLIEQPFDELYNRIIDRARFWHEGTPMDDDEDDA